MRFKEIRIKLKEFEKLIKKSQIFCDDYEHCYTTRSSILDFKNQYKLPKGCFYEFDVYYEPDSTSNVIIAMVLKDKKDNKLCLYFENAGDSLSDLLTITFLPENHSSEENSD